MSGKKSSLPDGRIPDRLPDGRPAVAWKSRWTEGVLPLWLVATAGGMAVIFVVGLFFYGSYVAVGSEMCIRDSPRSGPQRVRFFMGPSGLPCWLADSQDKACRPGLAGNGFRPAGAPAAPRESAADQRPRDHEDP